jgi:hypothetical protein
MKIACLCPTYKRPAYLANAAACFMQQNYEDKLCRLFVLDDAGQHLADSRNSRIHVETTGIRYPNLPAKFNRLARLAQEWGAAVLVPWEDDDVYLPNYLHTIASHMETSGGEYITHRQVWSTYEQKHGEAVLEGASGRFHASWAFTLDALYRVGGWPSTTRLDYDQRLGALLRANAAHTMIDPPCPGYVYRWGNGLYHGSQFGEGNWYNKIGQLPLNGGYVGPLVPQLDLETKALQDFIPWKAQQLAS